MHPNVETAAHPLGSDIAIERLTAETAPAFADQTYSRFRLHLERLSAQHIALGARAGGLPIALALGLKGEDQLASLSSIYVTPIYRAQGIGRRLIHGFTATAKSEGAKAVLTRIGGENPTREAFNRALIAAGWPPLTVTEVRVTGFAKRMADEGGEWKGVSGRLLHGGSITYDHWGPFSDQDLVAINAINATRGYCRPAEDFVADTLIERGVAVVIRSGGALIGWLLGYPAKAAIPGYENAHAIHYAHAALEDPSHQGAYMIAAFWHAFTRQGALFGPQSLSIYQTAAPRLITMSRRRFAPMGATMRRGPCKPCRIVLTRLNRISQP